MDGGSVTLFWRFWGVHPDGSLTNAGRTPVEHVWSRWSNVATCPRGHPAPAERCFCGLHVLVDEADVRKLARNACKALALGPVGVAGRMMRSEVRWDPPSTRRVERVALLGPLTLSPSARPYAEAVAARYGLPVLVDGWGG